MSEKKTEESQDTHRRIALRWKVMLTVSAILIVLGLFIDWPPPQEATLPDTSSFLIILGGLLGAAGLLTALRRE
jgi:hypothetical protein